ncbi:uncharacterized protein LOC143426781 [Xylocopa sonorina]|uniref:uncharacterized protein LOC143426781 n=1 Tax=Xylocopa sonorina TaxID=1818115 RepID=UPI00403AC988
MSLGSENGLEYKLITKEYVEDALRIVAMNMCNNIVWLGVGVCEEDGAVEELFVAYRETLKHGATLIAIEKETNKLVAVAFNRIQARPVVRNKDNLQISNSLKHRTCQNIVNFLNDVTSKVDVFERYNVNGAMRLFFLVTHPEYQGRGIAVRLSQKCIEFARGLLNGTMKRISIDGPIVNQDVLPEIFYAVFATNYSQKVANKLGFETLFVARYEDYTFDGKKMSERIGDEHKTAALQALKII